MIFAIMAVMQQSASSGYGGCLPSSEPHDRHPQPMMPDGRFSVGHSRVKSKLGRTYGLLEVIALDRTNDLGERQAKWRCRCRCGCGRENVVVRTGDLGRSTNSCGSLRQENGRRGVARINSRRQTDTSAK